MPIGCADESECQLECRAFFCNRDATAVECKNATRTWCVACSEHTHTHTHVHILRVLAQRFACESHAAVSNLASCYLAGHLVQAGHYRAIGDDSFRAATLAATHSCLQLSGPQSRIANFGWFRTGKGCTWNRGGGKVLYSIHKNSSDLDSVYTGGHKHTRRS